MDLDLREWDGESDHIWGSRSFLFPGVWMDGMRLGASVEEWRG